DAMEYTLLLSIKLKLPKSATNRYIKQFCTLPKFINGNTFLVIRDQIRYRKNRNKTNKKNKRAQRV
ncbi:hypothetical protein P4278_33270, partial [Bacillus thuringiensis]|nr:hypothetical protein [Bacillus thuringiensis]